jgi:hypothetical protein
MQNMKTKMKGKNEVKRSYTKPVSDPPLRIEEEEESRSKAKSRIYTKQYHQNVPKNDVASQVAGYHAQMLRI